MREAKTNEFPKMLYKFPSVTKNDFAELQGGEKFDILIVNGVEDEEKALAEGFFLTSPEAKEGKAEEEKGPATREELEQMAKDLKIKFVDTTTDEALTKLIEEKVNWK
jgi:hypothetical protein